MTRFDEERECLIEKEEIILVPELGARLGNFFAIALDENEAWLITVEWVQAGARSLDYAKNTEAIILYGLLRFSVRNSNSKGQK